MSSAPHTPTVRFLFVEDDEDHVHVVRRSLEKERVVNAVDHAPNGKVALEMLRKEGEHADAERPDVILLDLRMPVMDGYEVLDAIKNDPDLATIPVVIMTTSSDENDRQRAYEMRANSYVVKPIDFSQFRSLVRDLGLYWGVWNQPPSRGNRHE